MQLSNRIFVPMSLAVWLWFKEPAFINHCFFQITPKLERFNPELLQQTQKKAQPSCF